MRFKSILTDVLVEAQKQETIQKVFGFSSQWAEQFVSVNEKLSIWVANSFVNDLISKEPTKKKEDIVGKLNRLGLLGYGPWMSVYKPRYVYIFEWLRNVANTQNLNLKTLSYQEALNQAEEWHDGLEAN